MVLSSKQFIRGWLTILCIFIFSSYMHHTKYMAAINELESQVQKKQEENNLLLEYINQIQNEVKLLKETIELQLEEIDQLKTIRARITAYSPLDNRDGIQAEGNPNTTSTGKIVSRGYAAADPRRLPYGTKLDVPGYGVVEIQDTGGALRADKKNVRLDLFHETYPDAMKFGVKDLDVKILEWGVN